MRDANLTVYAQLEQGSSEWLQARAGIVTASVVGQLLSPKTLKPADNDTSRALTRTLVAERITGHVEETFTTADMERGNLDEPYARDIYAEHYEPVQEVGFMVRDMGGFKLGYSPDGLVAHDGLIEIKSRKQKVHLATVLADEVPPANYAQLQCGLLVSGRAWIDYLSYCGGMALYRKRVHPDLRWFDAFTNAAHQLEMRANMMIAQYEEATKNAPATERINHYEEIY